VTDPLSIIGRRFGDYDIRRYCGHGAAGHVYEAADGERRVALKIYKDWLFEHDAAVQDVAFPGASVHCCYFVHGREDERTGITRFVATAKPSRIRHQWLEADHIDIESAESWMGPLADVLERALSDVPQAKGLLIDLLTRANAQTR
jgi:hypothetical protein